MTTLSNVYERSAIEKLSPSSLFAYENNKKISLRVYFTIKMSFFLQLPFYNNHIGSQRRGFALDEAPAEFRQKNEDFEGSEVQVTPEKWETISAQRLAIHL